MIRGLDARESDLEIWRKGADALSQQLWPVGYNTDTVDELDEAPDATLARLHEARPYAVKTEVQQAWTAAPHTIDAG